MSGEHPGLTLSRPTARIVPVRRTRLKGAETHRALAYSALLSASTPVDPSLPTITRSRGTLRLCRRIVDEAQSGPARGPCMLHVLRAFDFAISKVGAALRIKRDLLSRKSSEYLRTGLKLTVDHLGARRSGSASR